MEATALTVSLDYGYFRIQAKTDGSISEVLEHMLGNMIFKYIY